MDSFWHLLAKSMWFLLCCYFHIYRVSSEDIMRTYDVIFLRSMRKFTATQNALVNSFPCNNLQNQTIQVSHTRLTMCDKLHLKNIGKSIRTGIIWHGSLFSLLLHLLRPSFLFFFVYHQCHQSFLTTIIIRLSHWHTVFACIINLLANYDIENIQNPAFPNESYIEL